jgi:predicted N-acetyltransferase YhbS
VADSVVEQATPEDLPGIVGLLDRVFIAPQGRWPSFANRFSSVLTLDGASSAWVIRDAGAIAACVLVKRRTFVLCGTAFELAMIGGVCTDPAVRGRGLASQLVERATAFENQRGTATSVLWTNIAPFYERLGWQAEDTAVFGMLRSLLELPPPVGWEIEIVRPGVAVQRLDQIRCSWLKSCIRRTPGDYSAIPLPAESVECLIAGGEAPMAYALVGKRGETGYVYEVVGAPEAFADLWATIHHRFSTLYVNEDANSPTRRWLHRHAQVEWIPQALAMWQGRPRGYVPYLDRI